MSIKGVGEEKHNRKVKGMTPAEFREMYQMVKEIYHHLGIDGKPQMTREQIEQEAKINVQKWRERQAKKGNNQDLP